MTSTSWNLAYGSVPYISSSQPIHSVPQIPFGYLFQSVPQNPYSQPIQGTPQIPIGQPVQGINKMPYQSYPQISIGQIFQGFPPITQISPCEPRFLPLSYPGGMQMHTTQPIPGYPGYPPSTTAPYGHVAGKQYVKDYPYVDLNRKLPFISMLDIPNLSRLTNDPVYHHPL